MATCFAHVTFTRIELLTNLRHARYRKEQLAHDMTLLELRLPRTMVDNAAILALDAEITLLETIIKKLWNAYTDMQIKTGLKDYSDSPANDE